MRIGIDVREYSHSPGGIGKYAAALAGALVRLAPEEDFILYGHNVFPAAAVGRGVRHRLIADTWRFGWRRTVWENLALPLDLRRRRVRVFHATSHLVPPPWHGAGLVFTVHDLTNFLSPEWYPARNNAYRRRMIARGIRQANAVIAVSKATAADLQRLFPAARGRTRVIYEGVDPIFSPRSPAHPPAVPAPCRGRFILFVGTLSPRKNIDRLMEAFGCFARLPKNADVHLVLVGRRGWMCPEPTRRSEELGIPGRVHHVGSAEDQVLAEVYRRALLVCLPSLYEGFGLPVVEGMASGTPVMASNRSSLPELVGDEASLADPEDVEAMAERMDVLVNDRPLRERIIQRGLAKAREFTWERAAEETLRLYREAG